MSQGAVRPPATICVTGANGYVGSHVVGALLADGYTVRATVRDPSSADKTAHIEALADELGARDRLSFARGDLMEAGSFDAAMAGCEGVVHTAASVVFNHPDPQKGIVDPSVDGTRNVLDSVKKAGTVKRVVHTSSMVAVYGWNKAADHVFSEADWNTASTLVNDPYGLAKVQGEKAARAYVDALSDEERFELVHLNPGMVFGPPLTKFHAKASPRLLRDVISRGQPGVPRLMLNVVDVREVADAHVRALAHEDPPPRCLLVAENTWMTDLAAELQSQFPDIKMGARPIPKVAVLLAALFDKTLNVRQLWNLVGRAMPIDNALSREAYGMSYRPVSETLRDTATPMIEQGWARVKRR